MNRRALLIPTGDARSARSATWNGYLLAIASVLVATAIRQAMDGLVPGRVPFITYFPATILVAAFGGVGPAMLSVLLGTLAATYFFVPPMDSLTVSHPADQISLVTYVIMGGLSGWLGGSMRRAAQMAHDREQKLSTTLLSIGDAVIATDRNGRIDFMNGVAEQLTGWTADEARGRPLDEVFVIRNELTGEKAENPVAKVLQEGRAVGLANHTVLISRSGARRPIDDSGAPIRDTGGGIAGVVMVFRDVSEQRAKRDLERRLAADEEAHRKRLDDLLGSVPGVVWEAWGEPDAASQRIDYVSRYVENLLGYSVEEWLSTPNFWLTIVHPEDREEAARVGAEAFAAGRTHVNRFRWVARDGRVIWCEAHASVIKDVHGNPIGMRGVTMDVSDRMAIELELESRARQQTALAELGVSLLADRPIDEALSDVCRILKDVLGADAAAVVEALPDGKRVQVRAGTGWRDEIVGLTAPLGPGESISSAVLSQTEPLIISNLGEDTRFPAHSLLTAHEIRSSVAAAIRLSDTETWGAIFAHSRVPARFSPQDGAFVQSLANVLSIAIERRRFAERAARHSEEISCLNQRLKRAMAETHHRIKNNLQVISALVDIQALDHPESVPTHELMRIERHVRALAAIHDLLTREAKQDASLDRLSARAALEQLLPMAEMLTGGRRVRRELDDVRIPVRQTTSLAVIMNELISNSAKHGAGDILVRLTVQNGSALLEVRDHGPGFPEGFRPDSFASTGLELVEHVVRWDLQGDVRFDNHPDGGARVTISWPAQGEELRRDETAAA